MSTSHIELNWGVDILNCRVVDLCHKDVINCKDGTRLGYVCDVEVDTCSARLVSIIIYGKLKCFGLLGREDDIIVNWCDIEVIGEDTILVSGSSSKQRLKNNPFYEFFFNKGRFLN